MLLLLGSFGSLIDGSLCKVGQLFICIFLFRKRCLKERHGFLESKFFRPSLQGAVASDFVMLDGLRGADQARIKGGRIFVFFNDLLALIDNAGDSRTILAPWRFIDQTEDLFQSASN